MTTQWTIGGDGANTPVTANGRLNGYTTPSRGDQISYTFYFQDGGIATDNLTRYQSIRAYGDYPGQVGTTKSEDGIVYFRERVSESPKSTHVVPIVPGSSIEDTGVWAAVLDVTDETPPPGPDGYGELTIECEVIAEYSEFADRTALGNARER